MKNLIIILLIISGCTKEDDYRPQIHDYPVNSIQDSILKGINSQRDNKLKADYFIDHLAERRIKEIQTDLSHQGLSDEIAELMQLGAFRVGENIASGQHSVKDVLKDWNNNPTHRDNIINESYKWVGIAYNKKDYLVIFVN